MLRTSIMEIPILRLYRLFNLNQTTLSPLATVDHEIVTTQTTQEIWNNFHDKSEMIHHPQPHYSPKLDRIGMPHENDFDSEVSYWVTLFHEGIHSTGAEHRLARLEVMNTEIAFEIATIQKKSWSLNWVRPTWLHLRIMKRLRYQTL